MGSLGLRGALALTLLVTAFGGCADAGDPGGGEAGLRRVTSCDDLLEALRDDARAKIQAEADRLRDDHRALLDGDPYYWPVAFAGDPAVDFAAPPPPEADGPENFTETNVQVAGVDEPDFVKTDGERIFMLHGSELFALDSWPAAELHIAGRAPVEGSPLSMFLSGDRVVVFSHVWIATDDVGGDPGPFPVPLWDIAYPYYGRNFVKVSTFDVSAATPALVDERYVEGSFRAARRHGDAVRVILTSDTWHPEWGGARPNHWNDSGELLSAFRFDLLVAAWAQERVRAVAERALEDFLPDEMHVQDGEAVAVAPRCTDYYAPAPGETSYGMTQVIAFSLDALASGQVDAAGQGVFVLGDAGVVYANHESLVVAQRDWSWTGLGWGWWTPWGDLGTRVHLFDLDGADTAYRASGRVTGELDGQFAVDVRASVVRLALTDDGFASWDPEDPESAPVSVSRVITLGAEEGKLRELGSTPDLAPGERIQSVRFVGERAYVVTFRRVDPLFVIDVSDDTAPTVLGEVKIPGFSTYMHPIAGDRLLTIGRNVDEATQQDLGMQLSIFDVSDPAAPLRTHAYTIPGYSPAEHDHLAFTYDARLGILAVPVQRWDVGFQSTLELFDVDVDAGIAPRASLSHSGLFTDCLDASGYYSCTYDGSVRRGLFIEDFVYTISYGGVTSHDLADTAAPLATVPLPAPAWGPYEPFAL